MFERPDELCPCGSGLPREDCCGRERRAPGDGKRAASESSRRDGCDRATRPAPDDASDVSLPYDVDALIAQARAAQKVLKPHLAEFEALIADPRTYFDRALALFRDDDFAPLCFSVEQVEAALEALNCSPLDDPLGSGEALEIVSDVVMEAADRRYRRRAASLLLSLLPRYVAAQRYIDAWIIYVSALQALEVDESLTPFLQLMLYLSFERIKMAMDALQAQMLRDLNVDSAGMEEMSPEELTARFCERLGAPDGETWARGLLEGWPVGRAWVEGQLALVESKAPHLFEREDARHLYLSAREARRWMREFNESVEPLLSTMENELQGSGLTVETMRQATDAVLEMAGEAAAELFTHARIQKLASQLLDYGRRLSNAGETQAAGIARGLGLWLADVEDPETSPALRMLCYYSFCWLGSESDGRRGRR